MVEKIRKELIVMKKILSIILTLCFVFLLGACGADKQQNENPSEDPTNHDEEYNYTFEATVLQTGASSILVQTDDAQMLRSSDQYWTYLPEGVTGEDFAVGDTVKITFDGMIRETYPAQIDALAISIVNK